MRDGQALAEPIEVGSAIRRKLSMSVKLIKRQYMARGCVITRVADRIAGPAWKILEKHPHQRFVPREKTVLVVFCLERRQYNATSPNIPQFMPAASH